MKTPISYYGGKQRLLKYILPLIPKHKLYAEPFAGGAAIFFAKTPSEIEVLNDTNTALLNFYKIAQTKFRKLKRKVEQTPLSKREHRKASVIYNFPELFSDVDYAWALWYLVSTSFASSIGTGMSYDIIKPTAIKKFGRKKLNFKKDIVERLDRVHLECIDAIKLIESRDSKDTFFYCDPPYFNANMGHYKGYTEYDFEQLLTALSNIKGKFLLSSYASELLSNYIKKYNWHIKTIEVLTPSGVKSHKSKKEILTANYSI